MLRIKYENIEDYLQKGYESYVKTEKTDNNLGNEMDKEMEDKLSKLESNETLLDAKDMNEFITER